MVLAPPTTNPHWQQRTSKACNSMTCLKNNEVLKTTLTWRFLNASPSPHFIRSWPTQVSQLGPHPWLQLGWMGRWGTRLGSHSWSHTRLSMLTSRNCTLKAAPSNSSLLGISIRTTGRGLSWRQELKSIIFQKQKSWESFPPCYMRSLEMTRSN